MLLCTNSETSTAGVGVEVALSFNDSQAPFRMVLGTFDIDKKSDHGQVFGEQAAARRYVRFLDEDKVFLTNASLEIWTVDSSYWASNEFPPIRQLERVVVTDADGFQWEASKTSSFSPITLGAPFGAITASPDLISFFEAFFQYGFHDGIIPEESIDEPSSPPSKPLYTVEAKDRFGGSYKVSVLRPLQMAKPQLSQESLKPGFLKVGEVGEEESHFLACKLEIELPDPDPQQISMMECIDGKEIAFLAGNFKLLEQITAELKEYEKTK